MRSLGGALLLLCACSSGGGGGGGDPTPFLGEWTVSGNGNFTSEGRTSPFSGAVEKTKWNVVFSKGSTSDLVSIDSAGCKLEWSVSGKDAKMNAPQTCTVTSGMSMAVNVDSSTVTLTPTDATHLSGSGDVMARCGTTGCSATAAGTFTKVP